MSCLWLLQTFIVLFIYTDLHRLKQIPTPVHKPLNYGTTSNTNSCENAVQRTGRTDYDEDIYKQIGPQSHSKTRTSSTCSSNADSLIETAENVISDPSRFKNLSSPTHDTVRDGHVAVETDYGLINGSLSHEERLSRQGSQDYIDSTEGSLNDYLQGKSKLKFLYHGKYCCHLFCL